MKQCKCMSRAVANGLQKGSAINSEYCQGFSLFCPDNFIVVHFNAGVCFKDHLDISSKIECRAQGSNPSRFACKKRKWRAL